MTPSLQVISVAPSHATRRPVGGYPSKGAIVRSGKSHPTKGFVPFHHHGMYFAKGSRPEPLESW
jgi:hypothetical protein